MRKGTLTDADTLRMYEDGVQMIALCIHEGMTPYGMVARLGRARRDRRLAVGVRRAAHQRAVSRRVQHPQPAYDTFDALRRAVDQLTASTRQLGRAA